MRSKSQLKLASYADNILASEEKHLKKMKKHIRSRSS